MNKFINIGLVVLSLVLASCGTTKINGKSIQKEHPFKLNSATYTFDKGDQSTIKEIHIRLTIDNPEIQLDSIYFRNEIAELKKEVSASNIFYVANYLVKDVRKDYNLHSDPQKEYGNTPPKISSKFPFELQKNEAVISYVLNGETRYYKTGKLVEIKRGNGD